MNGTLSDSFNYFENYTTDFDLNFSFSLNFRREKQRAELVEQAERRAARIINSKPKFYEQKDGKEFVSREGWTSKTKASKNASLAELLARKAEEGEFKTKNGIHEVRISHFHFFHLVGNVGKRLQYLVGSPWIDNYAIL